MGLNDSMRPISGLPVLIPWMENIAMLNIEKTLFAAGFSLFVISSSIPVHADDGTCR